MNEVKMQMKALQDEHRSWRTTDQERLQRLDSLSSQINAASDSVRILQQDAARTAKEKDSPEQKMCPRSGKPQVRVGTLGVKGQYNGGLNAQDKLCASDGKTCLLVHPTGNLILYDTSTYQVKWESRTYVGFCDVVLHMQHDGNLVAYKGKGVPYWHTNHFRRNDPDLYRQRKAMREEPTPARLLLVGLIASAGATLFSHHDHVM
ncbi:uncharacterized protein LOC129600006 [Paramacrobiotus metropolitanus]|uniref:uncharacterized protein LOC129600006 n=1 Tax=Paramacrobiotus metropolitanus TaxID=2943436 RepID=UPI002445B51E|nr:uncharacterized protein LOC129600006 [Paramacrobiotus metropolitanus]